MSNMEGLKAWKESGQVAERLDPFQKAQKYPKSLRAAVTAKCWDCVGAGADPNPRVEIRDCPILSCPLHPVRPWQATKP